jgi:CRISPR/Cas system-associated exonuclease Cas4 (RecB family)
MKRIVSIVAVALVLTACGTTRDPYERKVEEVRERQERVVKQTISEAPEWMTKLPKGTDAVYASGTAISGDFSMAKDIAETNAFRAICMAAGGVVRSQTKVFRVDTESTSNAINTTAIKSMCPDVDVTGTEIREVKVIESQGRFRAYVLVALPLGESNTIARTKERERAARGAMARADKEFKELDATVKSVKKE